MESASGSKKTLPTSSLVRVMYRPGPGDFQLPGHHASGQPEEPLMVDGRRYFTNCFNSNPTNGTSVVVIWRDVDGIAVPWPFFCA